MIILTMSLVSLSARHNEFLRKIGIGTVDEGLVGLVAIYVLMLLFNRAKE